MAEPRIVENSLEETSIQLIADSNKIRVQSPTLPNHQPSSVSDEEEEIIEYDEESPLGTRVDPCDQSANGMSEPDSPSVEESLSDREGVASMMMSQGHLHHGGGAMPLIILPVQSEGIPSSGALPLGRGNPGSPPAPPQGEELKKMLSQQLEYYFSKDNLSSDKYLLSQMDGDNYVPVSVISSFNQVKKLTTDMALILDSLRKSTVLQLDEREEKVRAIPEKRCVLILREIPKETPKEDIVSLFSHEKCPSCVTCEFADNDCWYVTFVSEESTQKAFAFLREQVKEFLGRPIRARIKGTTVQRSSGMPKTKHVPFPMQPVLNGTPQVSYYQAPPSGVMPWPRTSPTSSTSPYFDPSSFSPFLGNGFTPSPQAPNQVAGIAGQSPTAATGGVQPGNRYPYYNMSSMVRGEGDRGGRARMGPPNRSHRGGERGQSPPVLPNGDVPTGMDRDNKGEHKNGARGPRDHHNNSSGTGGGGGRFRHTAEERKIPRLKNMRHTRGEGERTTDKNQLTTQQAKEQPKLDLATAHFPPLPTSTSSESGTTPLPTLPTTSHTHMSTEDGQKTLSDIVKGNTRPLTKETNNTSTGQPLAPVISPTNHVAVASSVVESSIASAAAKLGSSSNTTQSTSSNSSTGNSSQPQEGSPTHTSATSPLQLSPDSSKQNSVASYSLIGKGSSNEQTPESSSVPPTGTGPRAGVTASSIVASGGGGGPSHHQNAAAVASRPPLPSQNKLQKNDSKPPNKDKQYGNGGNKPYGRYSDRDQNSSRQSRNTQVPKADNRTAPNNTNSRNNRYGNKVDKEMARSNRPPNGLSRQNHNKPSPKSSKKNYSSSHHSPQAPPPPPVPSAANSSLANTSTAQPSNSSSRMESASAVAPSQSQSSISAKPEKLSYAQMAQKKKNNKTPGQDVTTHAPQTEGGGSKPTSPPTSPQSVTTPPALPTQSSSKAVKSASSTGTLSVGQGQATSATIVSKSAPTSPTKESGGVAGGHGTTKVKENEV